MNIAASQGDRLSDVARLTREQRKTGAVGQAGVISAIAPTFGNTGVRRTGHVAGRWREPHTAHHGDHPCRINHDGFDFRGREPTQGDRIRLITLVEPTGKRALNLLTERVELLGAGIRIVLQLTDKSLDLVAGRG
jgi:hypothetical protein